MKVYFIALAVLLMALGWQSVNTAEPSNFVEAEDGLDQHDVGKRHWQWQKCWHSSECKPGFYCRGRWCYPKYSCSIDVHCPADQHCDVQDHVCKPGKAKCSSHYQCHYSKYCKNGECVNRECHYHKPCPYGYACQSPIGICKLAHGFCTEKSHCQADQCCLKGSLNVGVCRKQPSAGEWCDIKGSRICPCVEGYQCERKTGYGRYGRCVEEPGSGDIES